MMKNRSITIIISTPFKGADFDDDVERDGEITGSTDEVLLLSSSFNTVFSSVAPPGPPRRREEEKAYPRQKVERNGCTGCFPSLLRVIAWGSSRKCPDFRTYGHDRTSFDA